MILRSALAGIRKALRVQGQNIELLSLEGWCMYLVGAVGHSLPDTRYTDVWDEFRERWDELKAWDCSPWPYIEYFDTTLSAPPPKAHKLKEYVRG